ncbi:hypothetical protein [Nitrosopumilus ureiphilus]|uniref:Uncharacterized protein n=1 Tax=Nitrosopumilus ureiphilus TaxID=1470067 RepID=A0A7D5M6C4_9ARCH|nr:hypothetical protein [Nitrosopumilus ureiphilus]QLH07553.1 hypothetical protein C5F50_11110 [Nitrosopumilus ureiphilus]
MIWPGTSDPYKRKKTFKFLAITAGIGIVAVMFTLLVVNPFIAGQPRSACINDIDTNWKIQFTVEIIVDNLKVPIPANVGITDECQRAIYTLSDDGTVYAEWTEDPEFEIGHFMWIFKIPLKDMDQTKSSIYVNDKESPHFSHHPLQDGLHYKIVLTSKDYDSSKDKDFLPELKTSD